VLSDLNVKWFIILCFQQLLALSHTYAYVNVYVRWAGYIACMRERRGVYRVLMGKPEGKRPLRRPRCRWQDNIKMNFQEVGCEGVDWIDVAQVRDR
jgi:hypothetical protein